MVSLVKKLSPLSFIRVQYYYSLPILIPSSFLKHQTLGERFSDYLLLHGEPWEYSAKELGDLSYLFDWIALWLVFGCPKGGINIYMYVLPQDIKYIFSELLSRIFRVFFITNSKKGELEALIAMSLHDNIELIIMDGDHMNEVEGLLYNLNSIPPIIVLTKDEKMNSEIMLLDEQRVIASLWGCIRRKVGSYSPPYTIFYPKTTSMDFDEKEQTEYNHMYGPEDPPQKDLDPDT